MLRQSILRQQRAGVRAFSTTRPAQLARMQVIGRLAAEPELVPTSSGRDLVRYSIASDYGPTDARQTSWFRVASFIEGPRRDFLLSLPKGTMIHLDAEARMTQYEDESGKKRTSLSLIQRDIEVIRRPMNAAASGEEAPQEAATA